MNDLRWLHEAGKMHCIKHEHRVQIGQWLHDAVRGEDSPAESDAEDSAAEDSENTEASATVTVVAATRT